MKGAFTTPYEAKPLATNFACSLSPFDERVIPSAGSAVTRLQAAESPSKAPLANLAGLISEWKSSGGDTIRSEWEKSYAESQA